MNSGDPYRAPGAEVAAPEGSDGRYWPLLDVPVALVLLWFSVMLLNQPASGFYLLSIALGLFYFIGAFCVLRAYRLSRYILLTNGLLLAAIPSYFLYLGGAITLLLGVFYYGLALASLCYGWQRYQGGGKPRSFRKELGLFGLAVLVLIGLLATIGILLSPGNLEGPVIVN